MSIYKHGGDIYKNSVHFDFSANINPFGMPRSAEENIVKNLKALSVYPDAECTELRRAIAEYENVDFNSVLCGNGAADLIFSIVRALRPKRALLISPAFSEYERALLSTDCKIEYFALNEENGFVLTERFLDFLQGIDMVFICNPNNPVGNIIDRELMDKILDKCRVNGITAVVDECFMDFVADGYSVKGRAVVIKAFTKLYAMAGLRLGYMLGDSKITEDVRNNMPPWSVNAAASTAGIAALSDKEYREKSVAYINKERLFLTKELLKLGFTVYNSKVNFVLFRGDAKIYDALLKRGILIRQCGNFRGLDERYYRAAVRLREENAELIKALKEICNG